MNKYEYRFDIGDIITRKELRPREPYPLLLVVDDPVPDLINPQRLPGNRVKTLKEDGYSLVNFSNFTLKGDTSLDYYEVLVTAKQEPDLWKRYELAMSLMTLKGWTGPTYPIGEPIGYTWASTQGTPPKRINGI